MKRKFSFLAPLRIPSKAETRALKAHIEQHVQDVPSPLTPPLHEFINRRELDFRTETQLRAACTAVVNGEVIQDSVLTIYRPAHAKSVPHLTKHVADSRPQTSRQGDPDVPALRAHVVETRGLPNSKSVQDLRLKETATRQIPAVPVLAVGASHVPPSSHEVQHARLVNVEPRKATTISPTAIYRKPVFTEESDGSYATPRTASTDRHHETVSTGFTSTAITPSRPFQPVSAQSVPDHTTSKPTQRSSLGQSESISHQRREPTSKRSSEPEAPPRPSSRSRFRDWAFRPSSRGSARPNTAVEPPPLRRAASSERMSGTTARSSGGTGLTLHERLSQINLVRRSSSRGSRRPSVEGTHFEVDRSTPDLNLNRPLPRLPGLDTWEKHNKAETVQSEPTPVTTTLPTMHVVDLMKATAIRSPAFSAPLQHLQQFTKEITISPLRADDKDISTGRRVSTTHSRSTSTADSCFSPTSASRSRAPSASLSHDRVRSPTHHSHHHHHHTRGISDAPTAYSNGSRPSLCRSRAVSSLSESVPPNFSRKISIDSHGGIRSAEVTALPPMPVPTKTKPRGLRKVLSSFQVMQVGRKRDNAHWMEKFEKEGVKTGIMLGRANGGTTAPIVRY